MTTRNIYIEISKLRWTNLFSISLCLFIGLFNSIKAQTVGINATGATPNKCAVLDLSASTNGGLLLPTVTTTQMNAIPAPPSGTLVYNSTSNCLEVYYTVSSSWQSIICPCSGAPATPGTISGSASIASASTGNSYSIAAVTGAVSYTWTVQATIGTIVGSNTGSSITMNAATVGSNTTGTITVTATNSCGTSAVQTLTVTVTTTCSGTIAKDNIVVQSQQYNNTSSFSITTNHTNEVVLIFANGLSTNGAYGSTPTVSGGSASAVTVIKNSSSTDGSGVYCNSEICGFIAATAATYTITVAKGNNNYDINNAALALYGFCNTATIAANVTAATITQANGSQVSTLSGSLTPTVANSFLVANYYNYTYNFDVGTVTWTSPSSNSILGTDNNSNDGMDGSIDGYSQSAAAAVTFTVKDVDSYGADMWIANLQCLDVHN